MHTDLAGYMRQHDMSILQFNLKHGVWQCFNYRTFYFNYVLFGHEISLLARFLHLLCHPARNPLTNGFVRPDQLRFQGLQHKP